MKTKFLSKGATTGRQERILRLLLVLVFVAALIGLPPAQTAKAADNTAFFAVITDYGTNDSGETQVATMVDSWNPEFIVTTGDNWQGSTMGTAGSTSSYENVVGNYYGDYVNGNFYPVKGNHDYLAGSGRFETYFKGLTPPIPFVTHSGSASYYEFQRGPVHFFMLDSGPYPGTSPDVASQQAWLQNALAASTAAWNIVMFHKPAYTGGTHGNATDMQWDFDGWGADFVMAGHVHIYERIQKDGIRYFTTGASGSDVRTGSTTADTEVYFSGRGAMRVNASDTSITFEYVRQDTGAVVDTYTQTRSASNVPTITVGPATLAAFTSQPGAPSAALSYSVSGVNLTGSVTITPPAGFEISTSSSSGFSSSPIVLSHSGGTLAATTIYVRLNRATAGASSGSITHTSTGATAQNVAVSGSAVASGSGWKAYNDLAWVSGQTNTNITTYTLPVEGTATGKLVDYATGAETPVTVAITATGSVEIQTDTRYDGGETAAGTDAYQTFHGIADMNGVVNYGVQEPWSVTLTFSGLSPSQTYTFASSANRADTSYTARISRFTISGMDAAVNASTTGVTVKSNEAVAFSTGNNTANGYAARWTGINPGADGTFAVRVEPDGTEYRAYGPSVFMLQAEGDVVNYTLSAGNDGHGTVNLTPSGGSYASGTTVALAPVPASGYAFSHWSGPDAGDVVTSSGTHSIVMNEDKAVTANFVESDCTDVTISAVEDTYLRSSQATRNYGATTTINVSPLTASPQNALFRWDLSSIPVGATISAASMTFEVTDGSAYALRLYNMRRGWVEGSSNDAASSSSANWNTYNGASNWGTSGAQSTTADRFDTNLWDAPKATFSGTGSKTIPLNASGAAVVEGWVNNPSTNYGVTIQRDLNDAQGSGTSADYWTVASGEATNSAQWPRLNVTYCQAAAPVPTITASPSTLTAFTSQPGEPSAVQSYFVSGANLTAALAISAPADFQISQSSTTGFASSLNLTPSSGTVASTTIYVRFNRAAAGSSSGVINHTSTGADAKTVSVNGTATAAAAPWTAYNDVSGTSTPANTTEFTLDTTNGKLLNFDTGAQTGATVTMVTSSELYNLTSDGAMPASGTDAYQTFNGKANMTGVIMAEVQNPVDFTMDLVFNGLDPDKTYTFVTSVNRAGGTSGDPAYTNRFTRYTIMNMASATNASTSGVGVVNEHSVYFCTGENTTNGYVARWTNIQPNAQGSFTVRAQPHNPQIPRVYAYGVFMLQEEASSGEPVTVTVNSGQSKVYGSQDPVFTYTASPNVPLTGKLGRASGENAGSYPITIGTLSAGAGYRIVLVPANFSITAKPITVTAEAKSKVYGANDPALTYTVPTGALVGTDNLTGALTRVAGSDVGSYAIQQGTLTAGSNYTITFTPANLTITAKPITVTAEAKSKVYGDNDPALTYTVPTGALVGTDKITGAMTRAAGESVATYAIQQGTLTAGSNYTITFVPANLTITTRAITVTADNKSKLAGASDPTLTYTISGAGLAFTDTLTGTLARQAGETVGTYEIQRGSLTANSNYVMTFVPGTFTITTKSITVTVSSGQSKVYGSADPVFTYTVSDPSVTLTGALSRVSGENVGTYAIQQGTLSAGTEYSITLVPANFTITPKPASVRPDAASKFAGQVDPEFTGTLTGFLEKDAVIATYTRTSGETVSGSPYTISATLSPESVLSNYTITYYTAEFTIKAAEIRILIPMIFR